VVSNFQIATIDEIDIFVTDESLDESAFESLETHSVKSLVAKAGLIND
jgi:DeoR/GlpR family transcriptional regulator of sugar metabolism